MDDLIFVGGAMFFGVLTFAAGILFDRFVLKPSPPSKKGESPQ
jgi:hypothetical protein